MSRRLEITRPPEGETFFWFSRIWEKRIFLAKLIAAALVGSLIVVLILPSKYTAKVVLLPSGKQDKVGFLSGLAGSLGLDLSGATSGLESSSLLYPDILKSRIIGEAVLSKRYGYTDGKKRIDKTLLEYLKAGDLEKGLKKLAKLRQVSMDVKTGIISLEATTTNRELSALVANQFTAELERYNHSKRKTKALNNQLNIERRLDSVKVELAKAEDALEAFLENNRNFAISDDPELNRKVAALKREAVIKSETYATLIQQFELAKIETEKEIPIVQVLDTAVPPIKKSGPKPVLIVLLTTVFALASGLLLVYAKETSKNFFGQHTLTGLTRALRKTPSVENRMEQGVRAGE